MQFQKIVNLLNTTFDDKYLPRFVTKKWIEFYDQSGKNNYNVNKEIEIKTPMLRSDLCDFSDAYIVVKGDITVDGRANVNRRNKSVGFKNNAAFINCISKINGVLTDNAKYLGVVMLMYDLLKHNKNYKKQQVVCAIITEVNQVLLFLLTLNLLNTRKSLLEKRQMIITYLKC